MVNFLPNGAFATTVCAVNVEMRKMEGRPHSNAMCGTPSNMLGKNFGGFSVGVRKKTAPSRLLPEEGANLMEDIHVLQDENEHWNSSEKITFDDSESSDLERSNSSSLSWFDESEREVTVKVKNMMDNVERVLFGEAHSPLPRFVAEECQQWKLRFPYLRVVGKAVDINSMEVPKNSMTFQLNKFPVIDGAQSHSCNGDGDSLEEDKEETYACHGTLEYQPLLSHDFQQERELLVGREAKVVREALVDQLTKHVWKEVVEPRVMKAFMERFGEGGGGGCVRLPSNKRGLFETLAPENLQVSGKQNKDKCIDPRAKRPPFVMDLSDTATTVSSHYEPLGLHRRHSDYTPLSHRKCESSLAPSRISEERDEGEDVATNKPEVYWDALETGSSRTDFHSGMLDSIDLQGYDESRQSLLGERFQFPTPRCLPSSEVTEELSQRKKSGPSSTHRSEWSSVQMKYAERHHPRNESTHLQLPAIGDNKWMTNHEPNKASHGRSSSALPKLAPRLLRPTMSSYKNMAGEIATSAVKCLPFSHRIRPVEGEADVRKKKLNRSQKCSLGHPSLSRQERLQKEKYSNL